MSVILIASGGLGLLVIKLIYRNYCKFRYGEVEVVNRVKKLVNFQCSLYHFINQSMGKFDVNHGPSHLNYVWI